MAERTESLLNPERWVEEHGDALFQFALMRVGRVDLAEDLVQEAFLAALRSHHEFQGKSSERTWLVSILKHKVIDTLRRKDRELTQSSIAGTDEWIDDLFDKRGRWKNQPGNWEENPGASLENAEFWEAYSRCLSKLPQQQANAFTLRETENISSVEICKELGISATNLGVILYRARIRLWRCLEVNWFGIEQIA